MGRSRKRGISLIRGVWARAIRGYFQFKEASAGPEPEYLYVASGSSLNPDIDGLRFYDTGDTLNFKAVYRSEATDLSSTGYMEIWFKTYEWIISEARSNTAVSWSNNDSFIDGDLYGADIGTSGTVTISSI